jgi:hypothetical protein
MGLRVGLEVGYCRTQSNFNIYRRTRLEPLDRHLMPVAPTEQYE